MKPLLLATVLAVCGACATATGGFCVDDRDCPGQRCDRSSGLCVALPPADGGDGEAEAATCDPSGCDTGCRAEGYAGGACLGTTCQCVGTPPDGGPDLDDGSPDESPDGGCDPATCSAECAVFGLTGTCGPAGCTCGGGPDAGDTTDVPREDADVPTDDATTPEDAAGCPPGTTLCGTACVDTSSDPAHCGGCSRPCRSDQTCLGGSCACATGTVDCFGRCADTATDRFNCGSCGNVCAGDRTCSGGSCVCMPGRTECSGVCIDTASNPEHCGWCGNRCCGSCSGGSCVPSGATYAFTFPDLSDAASIVNYPYMWHAGDYHEGTRSTPLSCITGVSFTLLADDTYLDGDNLDLRLIINGTTVADFQFPQWAWSTSRSFTFPPIWGPTYTIRLQETRTVSAYCGSVALSESTSPWTFTQ